MNNGELGPCYDLVVGEEAAVTPPPLKGIRKSSASFSKSVLSLGGGAAFAQAIGILAMPFITRLFLPEAFGIAALFLSFSAVLACLTTFRYELTIVLPKEDAGAANILVLCFMNTVLVTVVSALLTGFYGIEILRAFNAPGLLPYRWLFPVSVFITGLSQSLRYWNTRNRFFNRLGIVRVASSLVKSLGLIGSGLAGLTTGGHMVVVRLLGNAVSPIVFFVLLFRHDLKFIVHHCRLPRIWFWAKRYKRFPLIDTWTALLNVLSVQVAVMVLMKYFGDRVAGLYSQSLLLLWLPTSLVGTSISQVSFQRFADHHASGRDISRLVGNLYRHLFSLGFLPFALLMVIGPDLFGAALGRNWMESGVYARMLAPWIFINFLYSPLSSVIYVFEKQHADFIFSTTLITGRLAALLFGACVLHNSRLAILAFGMVNLLIYSCISAYLFRCARVSLRELAAHAGRIFLISVPFIALTAACKWVLGFSSIALLAITALLSLAYITIIIGRNRELRAAFVGIIKRAFSGRGGS